MQHAACSYVQRESGGGCCVCCSCSSDTAGSAEVWVDQGTRYRKSCGWAKGKEKWQVALSLLFGKEPMTWWAEVKSCLPGLSLAGCGCSAVTVMQVEWQQRYMDHHLVGQTCGNGAEYMEAIRSSCTIAHGHRMVPQHVPYIDIA